MGPLRSALAAARRQRRRRGVFVSLYRPCCGAAAAIALPRQGPASPPNTHPPARPPSWRRARPPAATEARAPATPFSFLCLCSRGRLLARPITLPRPALCLPPLPRRVALAEKQSPRLGFPRPLRSRVPTLCRRARSRASVQYGCRALANASRAAHPPARPVPGTYLAALRSFSATGWSLPVRASPPLVSVFTEWRRRRCCGCEQRDPRAAESSLCKAG